MKKSYEEHEFEYRKMKEKGVGSWFCRKTGKIPRHHRDIDGDTERFLADVLAQPWTASLGKAIELGCGTAPLLRWICKRGFTGFGVDISQTAISMARVQSENYFASFDVADVCDESFSLKEKFDLAIDGHCLHCLTDKNDRLNFLKNAYQLLNNNGVFVVLTMCAPFDRAAFSAAFPKQKIFKNIIFVPYDGDEKYRDSTEIDGRPYLPTRYVGHWKSIMSEIRSAGFKIKLFRYNSSVPNNPAAYFAVAACKIGLTSKQ
jgi:SAM-dependent methyltransferase